jgi:hypothetical protein
MEQDAIDLFSARPVGLFLRQRAELFIEPAPPRKDRFVVEGARIEAARALRDYCAKIVGQPSSTASTEESGGVSSAEPEQARKKVKGARRRDRLGMAAGLASAAPGVAPAIRRNA